MPGARIESETDSPETRRTPKTPMQAPAPNPRELRDLPSFIAVASFFEVPISLERIWC